MSATVVIGAGAAGLAAATVLEQAGVECDLVEKRDFTGGRIASARRDGFTMDLGAQFFFSRYPATFEVAEMVGMRDEIVAFKPRLGVVRDGRLLTLSMEPREFLKDLREAYRARLLLSNRGRLQALRFAAHLARLGRRLDFDDPLASGDLDGVSLADYMLKHFSRELLEYVAQPVASTLTLGMPEEISATHGLALAAYTPPKLLAPRGGMGTLADAMASRAGRVRLSTEVTRVIIERRKVVGVELERGAKRETLDARNVVCAVTANRAARILQDLRGPITAALERVRYSACRHVMFALEEQPFGSVFAIALPRREGFCFSGLTDNSNKTEGYAPPGKGMVHVFTYDRYAREMLDEPEESVKARVISELKRIEPSFPDEPLFTETFAWPEALCLARPGHFADVSAMREALADYEGLHLAGEYFGVPSVEAAVHSGMGAARQILLAT